MGGTAVKTSNTFVLGNGTLTLPNGQVFPCTSMVITQERGEMVNDLGHVVHVGPPTVNIKLNGPEGANTCRYRNCREKFPDRTGGCEAVSCGVD